MSSDALRDLLDSRSLGTLATVKRDGRPQLSNVAYTYDRTADVLRISVTDDRAKTANLRRDPRASLVVSSADGWSYAVVEARAELLPVAASVDDASVEDLVGIYRELSGEHPDWAEFRQAMVADRRLPLHLHVERVYGMAR